MTPPHAKATRSPLSLGGTVGLQVLLVGRLRPELGVSGTHEGVPVADVRRPEAVQDALTRLTGPDGAVLVVCSRDDAEEVRAQLDLLAVALPRVTTLLEPVDGPPLALAVVAALVNDPDGSRDPAAQLAMLDELRAQVWSAVWLPSVAKLHHPQPSLAQHVRSWLGGAGFLAVHTPRPRVLRCSGTTAPRLDDVPADGALMVADSGSPSWVLPALADATGAEQRTDIAGWRDPRDAYGVPSCAELVVVPHQLATVPVPVDARECPACGNRHGRRTCPWCRMTVPDPLPGDAPAGTGDPTLENDDLQGADA